MLHESRDHIVSNTKHTETVYYNKKNEKLNSGRWKEIEHKKFLEAIIIHGNDWKLVQKCIKSRSSTQARSHAQKFLLKLRKKLKIEPDHTMKLSNESIDKIVREIIETSSLRNSTVIDKEKLVKLILGFSNLLVGITISPLKNVENSQNNNYFYNNNFDSLNENSYSYPSYPVTNLRQDADSSKNVFNIEKIQKVGRKNSITASTAESMLQNNHFIIEKIKKLDQNQLFNQNDFKTNNILINNQNDLIKYLFQSPQNLDAANPNKNIINIISINICNKNEGENNISPISNLLTGSLTSNVNSNPNVKKVNFGGLTNNVKTINSVPSVSNNKSLLINKNVKDVNLINSGSLDHQSSNSTTNSNSNYEQDFYEDSSASYNFNHQKTVEEDIDKFFDWN